MYRLPFDDDNNNQKPIYARSDWEIPQQTVPPISQKQLQIRGQEILKMRQNLHLGVVSNYPYNCVGMIFAMRRAWIEPDFLPKLLIEDGYIHAERSTTTIGDIVVYRNDLNISVHVGMIVNISEFGNSRIIRVLSKWGRDPEFIHDENNVIPYLGKPTEYWTLGHE